MLILAIQSRDNRLTHFCRCDQLRDSCMNIRGAQSGIQHRVHRLLYSLGSLGGSQGIAQHHCHRQNGCQRVGFSLARRSDVSPLAFYLITPVTVASVGYLLASLTFLHDQIRTAHRHRIESTTSAATIR